MGLFVRATRRTVKAIRKVKALLDQHTVDFPSDCTKELEPELADTCMKVNSLRAQVDFYDRTNTIMQARVLQLDENTQLSDDEKVRMLREVTNLFDSITNALNRAANSPARVFRYAWS